ncbi:MAG: segregation ATPase FtsK/SpoIIIE, family [Verrucomicrobiota bacterium]|jgi:S-DNA-T family DNA segregation ATPase FtsK/SpoIIIE
MFDRIRRSVRGILHSEEAPLDPKDEEDLRRQLEATQEELKVKQRELEHLLHPQTSAPFIVDTTVESTAPPPPPTTAMAAPTNWEAFDYTMPGLDLLDLNEACIPTDIAEFENTQQMLVETLGSFGVAVAPGDITKGPTITSYEIFLAKGVRVGQVRGLEHDLARVTRVERILNIAPVPGKETVAIDLPNRQRRNITLREIFTSEAWMLSTARIPVALGSRSKGGTVAADLADIQHLLIGGMAGSGKSSCVDAIILNLLFRFTPDELRLILIDPHYAQMQVYNSLPHLILPVITDARKVLLAFRHVKIELEKRRLMFAKTDTQDISEFNSRDPSSAASLPTGDSIPDRLPYIVVLIDELTDLVQSGIPEIESTVEEITENSAAAGIHFVITAKPPFRKIKSLLQTKVSARLAQQVRTEEDSYSLIDQAGAERLLGNGDMLFVTPAQPLAERIQGVLVSEQEIRRVVEYVSAQSPPAYAAAIAQSAAVTNSASVSEEDETLVEMCLEIIRQEKRASTSLLQRRLRLGYTRAAHIIDILEQRGILGSGEGARPREILVDLDAPI